MFENKDAFQLALAFTERKTSLSYYLKLVIENYNLLDKALNSDDPVESVKKKPFHVPDDAFPPE
ncbi:MAG: hypothetical protein ACMX3H_10430 [Sodalis sp. (in: enterobacteria)]